MGTASPASTARQTHRVTIAERVADRMGTDVETADNTIVAFLDEVAAAMAKGEQVVLRGFGVFEARHMRPTTRQLRGEPVEVAAKIRPMFRATKPLKERVNTNGSSS